MQTSILYQNQHCSVTLLDIPRSIALAQGRSDVLLSTAPLQAPIVLNDSHRPKSQNAKARKAQEASHGAQHALYKALVQQALDEIKAHVSGPWCMPRKLFQEPQLGDHMDIDKPEKELDTRLREWAACSLSKGDDTAFDLQKMMASLGATAEHDAKPTDVVPHKWTVSYEPARELKGDDTQDNDTASWDRSPEPWTSTLHNPEDFSLQMTIFENGAQRPDRSPGYGFTIPPHSTAFLSDSTRPDTFRTDFRHITDEYALPRHFDLVLLDPPWPNRSAKRKGAYEQVGGMPYLKKLLLGMDIDSYLEHNALVGIWVTNKEAMREHVLGAGGVFETWNVGLIEEWIWIKTTIKGEPTFDIDDVMRQPYEVLLLGRAAPNSWTTMTHAAEVKRRVISAVPDIHSRKPCLKELLEAYMPDRKEYTALEVFSRYLVSGWMSWGNEVLKFNNDMYWAPKGAGGTSMQHELPIRAA